MRQSTPDYLHSIQDIHVDHLYGERAKWTLCMAINGMAAGSHTPKHHVYMYKWYKVDRMIKKHKFILKLQGFDMTPTGNILSRA